MILDIRQERDLQQLLDRSTTDPILIFKHSTQCSISAQAYEEFEDFVRSARGLISGSVLVIENRAISDEIAERFEVRHESPQALLIKDGRVVWHASHWAITSESLSEALKPYAQSPDQRK